MVVHAGKPLHPPAPVETPPNGVTNPSSKSYSLPLTSARPDVSWAPPAPLSPSGPTPPKECPRLSYIGGSSKMESTILPGRLTPVRWAIFALSSRPRADLLHPSMITLGWRDLPFLEPRKSCEDPVQGDPSVRTHRILWGEDPVKIL